jgi:hypothetical protein
VVTAVMWCNPPSSICVLRSVILYNIYLRGTRERTPRLILWTECPCTLCW